MSDTPQWPTPGHGTPKAESNTRVGAVNIRRTNFASFPTLGGTKMRSRGPGIVAASDTCVAIIRTCPLCYEKYMVTPRTPRHTIRIEIAHAEARAFGDANWDRFDRPSLLTTEYRRGFMGRIGCYEYFEAPQ